MLGAIKRHFKNHSEEVQSTIKLMDVEERFDLAFSRFFGLYFAKIGRYFSMTPTQMSIVSLIFGLVGGYMFFYQGDWVITIWASVLVSLAGVLDSADGQLARMTGQSTELGRFIDGFIDSAVFLTIYLSGCAYYVQGDMGWSIFLWAFPAGMVSHIFASQMYDFYKCEFLYYVANSKSSRVKTIEDAKATPVLEGFWNRFFRNIEIDYTKRQWFLVSRTEEDRAVFEAAAFGSGTRARFVERYREVYNPIMFWWALIAGTNTHRTLIMLFSIMGRFDLYLIVCVIKLVPLAIVIIGQKVIDDDFARELEFELAV